MDAGFTNGQYHGHGVGIKDYGIIFYSVKFIRFVTVIIVIVTEIEGQFCSNKFEKINSEYSLSNVTEAKRGVL